MKKFRRLFAIMAAIAMMCTMVTGFAANTLEIESIQVLNDDNSVAATYSTSDVITLSPAQRLKVEVSMNNGADEPADITAQVTFLSYKAVEPQTYDNDTIQYINQEGTVAADGETPAENATFIFRPRTSFGDGTYAVKIGGDGITSPLTFNYTVATPPANMNISAAPANATFEYGKAASDVVYTVTDLEGAPTSITLGATDILACYSDGTITIPVVTLNELAAGNYTLTVKAAGYNDKVVDNAVVVTPEQTSVENDDVAAVEKELGNLDMPTETVGGTMTLPEKVLNDKYTVSYEIPEGTDNVTLTGNKLTLAENVPFAKVDVTATVNGVTETSTNTVYLIADNVTVGFGNLGLYVANNADAFAYDPTENLDADAKAAKDAAFVQMLNSLDADDKLIDRAIALNIALYNNPDDIAALPHFTDALDYNQNGSLTLAEYRIYRMMMAGGADGVHTLTNLGDQRQSFVDAAKAANAE